MHHTHVPIQDKKKKKTFSFYNAKRSTSWKHYYSDLMVLTLSTCINRVVAAKGYTKGRKWKNNQMASWQLNLQQYIHGYI